MQMKALLVLSDVAKMPSSSRSYQAGKEDDVRGQLD